MAFECTKETIIGHLAAPAYPGSTAKTSLFSPAWPRPPACRLLTEAPSAQLEVLVENGPQAAQDIAPADTPFVEVRRVDGALQLLPRDQEPPML